MYQFTNEILILLVWGFLFNLTIDRANEWKNAQKRPKIIFGLGKFHIYYPTNIINVLSVYYLTTTFASHYDYVITAFIVMLSVSITTLPFAFMRHKLKISESYLNMIYLMSAPINIGFVLFYKIGV